MSFVRLWLKFGKKKQEKKKEFVFWWCLEMVGDSFCTGVCNGASQRYFIARNGIRRSAEFGDADGNWHLWPFSSQLVHATRARSKQLRWSRTTEGSCSNKRSNKCVLRGFFQSMQQQIGGHTGVNSHSMQKTETQTQIHMRSLDAQDCSWNIERWPQQGELSQKREPKYILLALDLFFSWPFRV